MVQKKKIDSDEISMAEVGRELTESELMAICGGTKGSFNLPVLPGWPTAPQGKTAQAHATQNDFTKGVAALTTLTNNLIGTIL